MMMRGKLLIVISAAMAISACGNPQYKEVWEPYKATEYPFSAADAICKAEGQEAYNEVYNERMRSEQRQQKQETNVYVGSGSSGGLVDFSPMVESNNANAASWGASNAGGNAREATYNACMAKAGYHQIEKCIKNCEGR